MTENEFILFDRLEVIKNTINQYGEDTWCISFSGGKDSVVLHNLVDLALPDNKIPRVYANTGIEWFEMVKFVKKMKEKDDRIVMIQPSVNIKKVLEEYGYPFKSKQHSFYVRVYQRHGMSAKAVQFYLKTTGGKFDCPAKLRYQFTEEFKQVLKINDSCCKYMKEKPLDEYKKQHGKPNQILGLMAEEGGRRASVNCMTRIGKKMSFHPLSKVTKEWEDWFIKEYNIELCPLYYPPYNFDRSGCKGCPFSLSPQEQLETMELYFPNERKQCEYIWKPVYDEYRRLGYRLKSEEQMKLL